MGLADADAPFVGGEIPPFVRLFFVGVHCAPGPLRGAFVGSFSYFFLCIPNGRCVFGWRC